MKAARKETFKIFRGFSTAVVGLVCQDFNTTKNPILTSHTQRLPPVVPVNIYHLTQSGCVANTLPKVSHGQLKPQL